MLAVKSRLPPCRSSNTRPCFRGGENEDAWSVGRILKVLKESDPSYDTPQQKALLAGLALSNLLNREPSQAKSLKRLGRKTPQPPPQVGCARPGGFQA
eukprot:4644782-Amphidinium_carterae.1